MKILAVKLYEKGFMTQPFALSGEDGEEKFDPKVRYRSTLQNFLDSFARRRKRASLDFLLDSRRRTSRLLFPFRHRDYD